MTDTVNIQIQIGVLEESYENRNILIEGQDGGYESDICSSSVHFPTAPLIHGLHPYLAPKCSMMHPSFQQKLLTPTTTTSQKS